MGLIFCADGVGENPSPRLIYRNGYACSENPEDDLECWLAGYYCTRAAALADLRALERFAAAPEALETYEILVDVGGWTEGFDSRVYPTPSAP